MFGLSTSGIVLKIADIFILITYLCYTFIRILCEDFDDNGLDREYKLLVLCW